ncbi:MAG: hypothetical protein M0Q91_12085 [Methanoregula sp.]|nr:hypothetical protein [Methanoregula sp.]
MNNDEYVAICRRLDDAEKTLGCLAKSNVELRTVAKMLAEELQEVYKDELCWEEPGERSPALIAYKALVGEK